MIKLKLKSTAPVISRKINISIKPAKSNKPKIIKRDVVGIVVCDNDKYFVNYDVTTIEGFEDYKKILDITEESYNTRGKVNVWMKNPKGKGYLRIIRLKEEAMVFPVANAIPFRRDWCVRGNVIHQNNNLYFDIKDCYPNNIYENSTTTET